MNVGQKKNPTFLDDIDFESAPKYHRLVKQSYSSLHYELKSL